METVKQPNWPVSEEHKQPAPAAALKAAWNYVSAPVLFLPSSFFLAAPSPPPSSRLGTSTRGHAIPPPLTSTTSKHYPALCSHPAIPPQGCGGRGGVPREEMHRDRGAAAAAGGAGDRKRIGEPMDRSSPSTSWGFSGGREKERIVAGKQPEVPRSGAGSTAMSMSKLADEESGTDSEESDVDVSGSDGEDTSWISWFCSLRGNEFFCEVDEDYIQDDFNLCGLSNQVPYYDYALDLILDVESSHGDMFTEEQNELIESAAEMLYGLIHVRYIITSKGLAAMLDKYKNVDFGRCPRVNCSGQPCLPVGQSDIPRSSSVKIYCPRCEDIYTPRSKYLSNIDGTYFGTTFTHLFLMTYPHLKPQKPAQQYIPRVFGFKIHKP